MELDKAIPEKFSELNRKVRTANIRVNGDAENIMCMDSNYERCWMELYAH